MVIPDCFIILLYINHIQSVCFPCNLVQRITALVDLPHHQTIVWRRQISRLKPCDDMSNICFSAKPALLDKSIQTL